MVTAHDDERGHRDKPDARTEPALTSREQPVSDVADPGLPAGQRRRRAGSAGGGPYAADDTDTMADDG